MRFVAYYRVSTTRQDYGIDAQKAAVARHIAGCGGKLIASFEEKESGSENNRPQLTLGIALAKSSRATLIIAKLDRLSRNASFLMSLQDSCLDFVCCDMPNADRFTIGILALVAQRERELISQRTIAGLAVAKARGVTLGNPNVLEAQKAAQTVIKARKDAFTASAIKIINEIRSTGVQSLNRLADCLNKRGEKSAMGKRWTAAGVKRVLDTAST